MALSPSVNLSGFAHRRLERRVYRRDLPLGLAPLLGVWQGVEPPSYSHRTRRTPRNRVLLQGFNAPKGFHRIPTPPSCLSVALSPPGDPLCRGSSDAHFSLRGADMARFMRASPSCSFHASMLAIRPLACACGAAAATPRPAIWPRPIRVCYAHHTTPACLRKPLPPQPRRRRGRFFCEHRGGVCQFWRCSQFATRLTR